MSQRNRPQPVFCSSTPAYRNLVRPWNASQLQKKIEDYYPVFDCKMSDWEIQCIWDYLNLEDFKSTWACWKISEIAIDNGSDQACFDDVAIHNNSLIKL